MSGIEYRPCIYRNGNLKPMHVRVILIFMETDRHEAVVNARCHTFLFHLSLIWIDCLNLNIIQALPKPTNGPIFRKAILGEERQQ